MTVRAALLLLGLSGRSAWCAGGPDGDALALVQGLAFLSGERFEHGGRGGGGGGERKDPNGGAAPSTAPTTPIVREVAPLSPFRVRAVGGRRPAGDAAESGPGPCGYEVSVENGTRPCGDRVGMPSGDDSRIHNATDNAPRASSGRFAAVSQAAAKAAARPAVRPKTGDRMDVMTESGSWTPCLVVGAAGGGAEDTYLLRRAGRRDLLSVHADALREAAASGRRDEQAGELGGTEDEQVGKPGGAKDQKGEAPPHSSRKVAERQQGIRAVADQLTRAYRQHKKHLEERESGKDSPKTRRRGEKGVKGGKASKDGKDSKDEKMMTKAFSVFSPTAPGEQDAAPVQLRRTGVAVHPQEGSSHSGGLGARATAFFAPEGGPWCMQGELSYMQERLARLKASFLAEAFPAEMVVLGTCREQGFEEGPAPDACFAGASLYFAGGPRARDTPLEGLLPGRGSEAVAQELGALCD